MDVLQPVKTDQPLYNSGCAGGLVINTMDSHSVSVQPFIPE